MIIQTDGLKETILCIVGLFGECEKKWLCEYFSDTYSISYINKSLSEMTKEGLIKTTSERTLRLKKPKGLDWLKDNVCDLYQYYMLTTNKHHFLTDPQRTLRRSLRRKVYENLFAANIPIDYFDIHRKTSVGRKQSRPDVDVYDMLNVSTDITFASRSVIQGEKFTSFEHQLDFIEEDNLYFFSNFISRKTTSEKKESSTTRNSTSRMYGVIIGKGNFYPVYCVNKDSVWNAITERQSHLNLRSMFWGKYGTSQIEADYRKNKRGEAIFFYQHEDALSTIASRITEKNKKRELAPWSVYDASYYIPLTPHGEKIQKIIFQPDWQEKLKKALFGESSVKNMPYDAIIENKPAWEFLTQDVCKLQKIKKQEKAILKQSGEVIIVAHESQKKLLTDLFDKPNLVLLTDKDVKLIKQELVDS